MEELKNKFDKIQEVISFIEVSEKVQLRVDFALVVGDVIGSRVCTNTSIINIASVSFFFFFFLSTIRGRVFFFVAAFEACL